MQLLNSIYNDIHGAMGPTYAAWSIIDLQLLAVDISGGAKLGAAALDKARTVF